MGAVAASVIVHFEQVRIAVNRHNLRLVKSLSFTSAKKGATLPVPISSRLSASDLMDPTLEYHRR